MVEPLPPSIAWSGGVEAPLELLDQTQLPHRIEVLRIDRLDDVIAAIRRLSVRGAPAIGVAAAYGLVVGVREFAPQTDQEFERAISHVGDALKASRPTAVNLGWAVDRLLGVGAKAPSLQALLDEAKTLHREDRESCAAMGRFGAERLPDRGRVMTICNTGRLATAGDGTALAAVFEAKRQGKEIEVVACETRPLLQGARLTAFECVAEGIPVEVCTDGAAASILRSGVIDCVLAGSDRVAANGDAANKIGTYSLALAAKAHDVPMYVVAPASTFDLSLSSGDEIPIEERNPDEVLHVLGQRIASVGARARNPAFDVTPAELLAGIATDRGWIDPVNAENVRRIVGG
ncbi:MAG: S-methyl-5-thioribose-1-phosphate isomerase [Planctomycetota bacterium]